MQLPKRIYENCCKMNHMSKQEVMVRVPKNLIDTIRNKHPDLADEDNAVVVRIALKRYIQILEQNKTVVST